MIRSSVSNVPIEGSVSMATSRPRVTKRTKKEKKQLERLQSKV
jgi:hypothetical protein